MGSPSKCFISVILISLTFFLFNSPLLTSSSSCNPNSVSAIPNIHILSRFRSLLDLKIPNFPRRKTQNGFSSSLAPSHETRKPYPSTKFHEKKTSHSPSLAHHQSFHNEKNGTKNRKKNLTTIIVISICVSVLVMVIIFIILSILFCNKSKGKNKKVNFDPGPELFYLNSLTHCIDIHDTNLVKSSSSLQNERRVFSSPFLPSPFENRENTSFSDEETLSFHSARASNLSELPQNHSHSSLNSSPNNSSYKSISHFCSSLEKPYLSNNLSNNLDISHVSIKSTEVNDSHELHLHANSPPARFLFPQNRNKALSLDVPKSQDSLKCQIPNDFPRNRKIVTFSEIAIESQDSSKDQVLKNLLRTSKSNNHPKPPPPPPIIQLSKNDNLSPPLPPFIQLSKNDNFSKPPPPPPPPPPPMKQTSYQKVPFSPIKNLAPDGKDGNTLAKLKPLHWDKVRAAPHRSMVWDQIQSSSFEFDEEKIESLFGYKLSKSVLTYEEAKSKTPSPSKNLLDHNRLQNITILLKALNATPDQVCHALIKGSGLSVQQLEALVKMTLTKEEEENLSKYPGDIEELEPAEKLVKIVLTIPCAFAKIEMMLFKETFEDEVSHLKNSLAMLKEACKELKSSNLFLRLLEAVLKTGNRMNVGTTRGDAKAFKLDALLKLADIKGTDGKTTLLHFVIQEINKLKHEESEDNKSNRELTGLDLLSGLSTELSNVKKTGSIDLDVIIGSIENLSLGMSKLKRLVRNDLCVNELNLRFMQSMRVFMQNAEGVIEELKNEEKGVLLHVREITEYYHGDLSKDDSNPLRIFVIVRDFLAMLDRVCKELRKPKINQMGPQLVILTH